MDTAVAVAIIAAFGAVLSALFTFYASRKSSDDSRAIGLINAGQTALEAALERTTSEIQDARSQIEKLRDQLKQVRTDLQRALDLHAECERLRLMDSREIAELRALLNGRDPNA